MTTRASRTLAIGAIVAAFALTGCSGDEPDSRGAGTPTTTSSATKSAATGDQSDNGATAAGVDAANPPKPIASLTLPGSTEEQVQSIKADLLQLTRDGKVVKAVVALTPTFVEGASKTSVSIFEGMGRTTPDTRLIDPVNLKLYKMFETRQGIDLESDVVDTKLRDGQVSYYWAVLAAPPESVTKVNVTFGSADMMMGVPIS